MRSLCSVGAGRASTLASTSTIAASADEGRLVVYKHHERRPVLIAPDDAIVYRIAEVAAMVSQPGASLRSVAAELGWTHTRLWRALRNAGYAPTRGYGIPGDFNRKVSP
jgi:hypothetical protein